MALSHYGENTTHAMRRPDWEMSSMKTKRVYDYPTRVFHWLFALLFVIAFTIGTTVDDDSALFLFHMLAGLVLCALVLFRVIWGFVGTKHARFSGFALHPKDLLRYAKDILAGTSSKWPGHNPASSWAAILMMAFALGLGITGYLMANDQAGDYIEDLHELLANGFLTIVLLHIAGLALHSLRHQDGLWKSMFTGLKTELPEQIDHVPAYLGIGTILLLGTVGFSGHLVQNLDSNNRTVTILGTQFVLGEQEDGEHANKRRESGHDTHRKHHDHDDD